MKKRKLIKNEMGTIDYGLFCTIFILLAIGIVMVYSASSYYSMFNGQDSTYFLRKQLLACALGVVAMLAAMSFDYHRIKKWTVAIMIITIPLLLLVYAFPANKGAQRWIYLGPLSFQPSELAKYVVVIALALILTNKGDKIKSFWMGVVPCFCVAGFYAGLVLAQKSLSVAVIIMATAFIMIFAAGAQNKQMFGIVTPAMIVAALVFALGEDYRRERMLNFIDPWKDAADAGYQLIQSFYALGAGGLTGLGLGQSRQKTLYMPEPHNDFILSIIGEELGLIGCLVIIALFVILIWRGIRIAIKAKDTYGSLLALGITSIIGVQTIINIAVVTGSMPVTGVTLPFISYGGTSLAITMLGMGILLNISRQIEGKEEKV